MHNHPQFQPGETIVVRGILKGKLWWACPAFVVRDTPELLALHWKVGTPIRAPITRPTVQDELDNRVELEYRHWIEHDVLSLIIPGYPSSIDMMWKDGTLTYWYVQLLEPFRRSAIGFDTMDLILDVVISADKTSWTWKDEDEFAAAEAIGVYSPEKIQSIRLEGERVIGLLESNASPFCDGWEHWTPPPEWGTPKFPAGWENFPL